MSCSPCSINAWGDPDSMEWNEFTFSVVLSVSVLFGIPMATAEVPPPLSPIPPPPRIGPPPEDFGYHRFYVTGEQVKRGLDSQITSAEQRGIWLALKKLIATNEGYHTAEDMEKVLGIDFTEDHTPINGRDDESWRGELPHAHIQLFVGGPNSIFREHSTMSIRWDNALSRPECIGANKALAEIHEMGGIGVFERGYLLGFEFPQNETVTFGGEGVTEDACISVLTLIAYRSGNNQSQGAGPPPPPIQDFPPHRPGGPP